MKIDLRKLISLFAYYIIPLYLFFYVLYIIIYLNENLYKLMINFGEIAFKLVLFILFIKPISIIFNKVKIFKIFLSYRRELGVLSFYFAVFHSISLIFYLDLFSVNGLIQILNINNMFLLTGFLGFIGMFILGISSNKLSVIKLKKNWKRLQYLVYPTFLLITIHNALAINEIRPYIIFFIFVLLKLIAYFFKKKRKKSENN